MTSQVCSVFWENVCICASLSCISIQLACTCATTLGNASANGKKASTITSSNPSTNSNHAKFWEAVLPNFSNKTAGPHVDVLPNLEKCKVQFANLHLCQACLGEGCPLSDFSPRSWKAQHVHSETHNGNLQYTELRSILTVFGLKMLQDIQSVYTQPISV